MTLLYGCNKKSQVEPGPENQVADHVGRTSRFYIFLLGLVCCLFLHGINEKLGYRLEVTGPRRKFIEKSLTPNSICCTPAVRKWPLLFSCGCELYQSSLKSVSWEFFFFFGNIGFREKKEAGERKRNIDSKKERERNINLLLMHSLGDFCMCPDQGLSTQPWHMRTVL